MADWDKALERRLREYGSHSEYVVPGQEYMLEPDGTTINFVIGHAMLRRLLERAERFDAVEAVVKRPNL